MKKSCPKWTSHVPHECMCVYTCVCACREYEVKKNESCTKWMTHVFYEQAMSLWTSHVPNERVMSHMHEPCPIWMYVRINRQTSRRRALQQTTHVPNKWVMSQMNKSCPKWMNQVPYEQVMFQMNESCPVWTSHVSIEWVVSYRNESLTRWCKPFTWDERWGAGVETHFQEI